MPTVRPSASAKTKLSNSLSLANACHQAASHSGVWNIEDAGLACKRRFQQSRTCSNSSQVRQMRTVHSSAMGWDSSASAGSVWAATMDLHHGKVQLDCQPERIGWRLRLSK